MIGGKQGGSNPKYLNLGDEPKKQVSFRLPISLNDKIQNLAKITNKTNTETIETILNNFLEHKILTNSYLDLLENEIYIKIPQSYMLKENIKTPKRYLDLRGDGEDLEANEIIKTSELLNISESKLFYNELIDALGKNELLKIGDLFSIGTQATAQTKKEILDTIKDYEILLIPNNLDVFNYKTMTYETIFNNGHWGHAGLDFIIIPEMAKYTDDLTNALYIFYFKFYKTNLRPYLSIFLINYIDALDVIGAKNENLKNLLKTIYTELGQAQNQDTVKAIAKTYNTGNIINVSDNQTPKPDLIKIIDYYNTNVTNYSYETLNNKLEALEKENQDLKKELEYISEALDDKLQRLDEINKIFEKYEIDKILNNKGL